MSLAFNVGLIALVLVVPLVYWPSNGYLRDMHIRKWDLE